MSVRIREPRAIGAVNIRIEPAFGVGEPVARRRNTRVAGEQQVAGDPPGFAACYRNAPQSRTSEFARSGVDKFAVADSPRQTSQFRLGIEGELPGSATARRNNKKVAVSPQSRKT